MDSDHLIDKSRKKKSRVLPDYKSDNFGLNLDNQDDKSNDFLRPSSRFSSKKYSLEPEHNTKHWTAASGGFPPGVTVDELKKYGRRRQPIHLIPQDNLRLEEGSLKSYKSEYNRRFRRYGLAELSPLSSKPSKKKEFSNEEENVYLPEYKQSFVDYPRGRPILKRPPNNLLPLKDLPMESQTEKNSQYIQYPQYEKRKLLRRSTALKPEGEMSKETEVRCEYRGYDKPEKVQIVRRLPTLKLEGEFETMTSEQREKFIAFLLGQRPVLEKKKTSLKMEGDFDFQTEKRLRYIPHEFSERPPIRKRSTSLKLDGEVEFFPEYKNSFVDFPRTRPITYKPNGNLRNEGELENRTETKAQFVNFENVSIPQSVKPGNNLHIEGEMEISPEYRINYVDFPRERPFVRRPMNQLKPEGDLQILTESSEKFSGAGTIQKAECIRRPTNLKLEGDIDFLSEKTDKFKKYDVSDRSDVSRQNPTLKPEGKMDFVTEKADKFGFSVPERENTERRSGSLKLDGEFLFVPQNQKSYIDFGRSDDVLKPTQNIKSSPNSPRKKPKELIKFDGEEEKKSNLGTPRRSNAKRLKENVAEPEKNLKFDVPKDLIINEEVQMASKAEKEPEIKIEFPVPEIPKPGEIVPESSLGSSGSEKPPPSRAREFQAFQVLDVKGQTGCQSLRKDIFDTDKYISDDDNSTYRLEVYNGEEGFHKNNQRIFPNPALKTEDLLEAEKRARKRAESYVKVVKNPEIPNYLLDNNGNIDNKWKVSGRISPLPSESLKSRAFVVLDNCEAGQGNSLMSKDAGKGGKENWAIPDWLKPSPLV